MNIPLLRPLSFCVAVFFTAGGVSSGQTFGDAEPVQGAPITWSSNFGATNYMADGVTTFEQSSQSIYFQLGTFAQGFDPSTASPADWAANWLVLEGTDGFPQTVYNKDDQQFIQTSVLSSNAAPFTEGGQVYIWGYTSKAAVPTSQWILLAVPDWKWPNSGSLTTSNYSVGDAHPGDTIIGAVNGSGYHMQLEWAVVPEPSGVMMVMMAGVAGVWRRRRGEVC